jgi:alpha-beta hydrolase superfamily lysophospholipase
MEPSASDTITPGSGEDHFASWDSTRLFYRWSRPASMRGIVVGVHGVLEHSGRYAHVERALTDAGFGFYVFDHRGHGHSDGPRGCFDRFDDLVGDAEAFCTHVRATCPEGPTFLVGHSMGAVVAARTAVRCGDALSGLVLSGTPARLPLALRLLAGVARPFVAVAPNLPVRTGVDPDDLSHDTASVEQVKSDPLRLRRLSLRWGVELVRAIETIHEYAPRITVPVLLEHGADDPIADVDGARRLLELIGSTDKELIVFPGLLHEVYNETDDERAKVLSSLVAWLERHVP